MDSSASPPTAVHKATTKAPINWPAAIMFPVTTLPVLTLLPWYLATHETTAAPWLWALALLWLNGLGITAGYHRLWAHRTYTAHPALKWFLALFGGMAVQNSILVWAAMHRVHHKHVDHIDHDPYSAKRGFWYSHMGWMLRDYPSSQLDYANAKDLLADKVVMFQHRHYNWFAFGTNIAIPVGLGLAYGDVWSFVLIAGFLRLVVNHHVTFFINSLAHMWGRQPYTTTNTARDNDFIALLTYGEGYHNYHHLFQMDYRNGIRWWHFDPTKWLIAACSWVGLSKDLKRVPNFKIQRAMLQAQFERAREKLARYQSNPSRFAELQHLLETEWQQFSHTVAEWSKLQGEKLDAAKLHMAERVHEAQAQLHDRWEASEMRQKLITLEKRLEDALEMQRERVALLRMQMATA